MIGSYLRFTALAGASLVAVLLTPTVSAARPIESTDVVSVPTRDVTIKKVDSKRALITLGGLDSQGLIVSSDPSKRSELLSLKRFDQRFNKLGFTRSPDLRLQSQGNGRKPKTYDYRVISINYRPQADKLDVLVRMPKRLQVPASSSEVHAMNTVNISAIFTNSLDDFKSGPGPFMFHAQIGFNLHLTTFVTGADLSRVSLNVINVGYDGGLVYIGFLTSRFPTTSISNIPFGIGGTFGPGQFTLTPASSTTPGSVSTNLTLGNTFGSFTLTGTVASWTS